MGEFSTTVIGLMGAAYFSGFALGCVVGPLAIKWVGHIRCFAGFAALTAALALLYPLAFDPIVWCVLRGASGLCLAVCFMIVESWLNDQSSNEVRGQVLSIYIIVTNLVTIGGQLAVNLYIADNPALFSLVAILIGLSLVPLALTPTAAPKPVVEARLRILRLFRLSPTACLGCLAIGTVEGAFWSLGPVFAQGHDLPISQVTIFMGAFVMGGTLSQWPLGRYSDKVDRRLVIMFCAVGTVCTALALTFASWPHPLTGFGLAVLHGAFMVPIYPLLLAHANDYAPNDELVEVSGGLLLIYASGAALGPLVVGPAMGEFGIGALFFAMVVVLGIFALFVGVRITIRAAAKGPDRVEFVPVPKTTPSVYSLETDD